MMALFGAAVIGILLEEDAEFYCCSVYWLTPL